MRAIGYIEYIGAVGSQSEFQEPPTSSDYILTEGGDILTAENGDRFLQ